MIEYFLGFITGVVIATLICSKRKDNLKEENENLRLQLKTKNKETDDID